MVWVLMKVTILRCDVANSSCHQQSRLSKLNKVVDEQSRDKFPNSFFQRLRLRDED